MINTATNQENDSVQVGDALVHWSQIRLSPSGKPYRIVRSTRMWRWISWATYRELLAASTSQALARWCVAYGMNVGEQRAARAAHVLFGAGPDPGPVVTAPDRRQRKSAIAWGHR